MYSDNACRSDGLKSDALRAVRCLKMPVIRGKYHLRTLNMQWQPKQMSEEEMSTIELQLKEQTTETQAVAQPEAEKVETIEVNDKGEEENYLIKRLRKTP